MSPEIRSPRLEAHPSAEDEFFREPETDPVCTVDQLHDGLKLLTTRQRFVIELRYGMRDGYCYPVAQVADMMGVSHVAIVKLEQAAVAALEKGLQPYLRQ